MDPERWADVRAAFERAVDLEPKSLAGYLSELEARDATLAREVARLLCADDRTAGLLDGLAVEALTSAPGTSESGGGADGQPDESGRRVGPYALVRPLGSGGMGTVWLAERADGAYRGQVAIKFVRAGLETEEAARRFLAERQILASLEHPNIARLLDGGTSDDGTPYLVMELVEGEPIDEYCDRRRLTVDGRIELFLEACGAVRYAHRRLIVHRDIKPGNLLVTPDGVPKLLDFGIAKLLDESEAGPEVIETRTGARVLTPRYASPEQVRGEPITAGTDVYSLGVLLYQLLTGAYPYRTAGTTAGQVERAILEEEPTRPSRSVGREADPGADVGRSRMRGTSPGRLRRRLAGDLDTILLAALRKDPERRYASVEAFARDLEHYLKGLPVAAQPDTWRYRTAKFVRRNRTGVAVAAGFVVLLAGSSVALALQAARVGRERDAAERERAKAEQVAGFLADVFESSDPNETQGVQMTAGEILSRGGRRIRTELAGQPEVQASVLDAIGDVYQTLGEYDSAAVFFRTSRDLREETVGSSHADYAESLTRLGALARVRGRLDEAIELHRRALDIRRAAFGAWSEPVAQALSNLGTALHENGEPAAAESLLVKSLEIRRDLLDPSDDRIAQTLNNLSLIYDDRGSADTAIAMLEEALDIRGEALGENHVDYAIALNNLATAYENAGRYDEAERRYRESLAIRRRLLGDAHPDVATVRNNLAVLFFRAGRTEEAVPLMREVIAFRRTRPEERFKLATPLNNLGQALLRLGRYEEALEALEECLELLELELGTDHPALAFPLSGIGNASAALEDHARAEAALRRALSVREEAFEAPHPLIATSLDALGSYLLDRGLETDAEPLLVRAWQMRREVLDADHPDLAVSLVSLGELRLETGEPADAERLLREALRIREAKLDPRSVGVAVARGFLGRALDALGRPDEAEPLLVASYEGLAAALDTDHPDVRAAAERLAAFYERRGDDERAAELRRSPGRGGS